MEVLMLNKNTAKLDNKWQLLSAVIATLATRQVAVYLLTDKDSVPRPLMGFYISLNQSFNNFLPTLHENPVGLYPWVLFFLHSDRRWNICYSFVDMFRYFKVIFFGMGAYQEI